MNYRHHFHAGNFADVLKHALLIELVRALQRKEKGFLYLDTHAGRGAYDLSTATMGDSSARRPEWPDGIGRLLGRTDLPAGLLRYVATVGGFDARKRGGIAPVGAMSFYPGSPSIVREIARVQDRLIFCERHPEECSALRDEFQFSPGTQVREADGYATVRAVLPPIERRALILIDPPFEAKDEFRQITRTLREGFRRFPAGVFAVWYPLTERAGIDDFIAEIVSLRPPPTLVIELLIAGAETSMKMKGCGVVIVNPPWQFQPEAAAMVACLSETLAQGVGGGGRLTWLGSE
ncbi:MAG: 23S rRNA (adenine(2030)-N(6))-methyltransferase RlmJ [Verrucomicrobiales bacterium]